LITKDQDVLYKIFEWFFLFKQRAKFPKSKLILVGIANALDLTKRFLPRLEAKNVAPDILVFQPYNVKEISSIIKARLMTLHSNNDNEKSPSKPCDSKFMESPSKESKVLKFLDQNELENLKKFPLMHPMAVEFAARKIAASGDLRKALDVCRYLFFIILVMQLRLQNLNFAQMRTQLWNLWTNYRKLG
jgi:cell division control protein 6